MLLLVEHFQLEFLLQELLLEHLPELELLQALLQIQDFLEHLEIESGRSKKTIDNYRLYLERFLSIAQEILNKDEVKPGDIITFANGTIDLSLDLDNRFAEKKISIVFVVESLQIEGIEDPLAQGTENAKYHAIWGS